MEKLVTDFLEIYPEKDSRLQMLLRFYAIEEYINRMTNRQEQYFFRVRDGGQVIAISERFDTARERDEKLEEFFEWVREKYRAKRNLQRESRIFLDSN